MIRPIRISKFLSPRVTVGLVGTLAIAGTENSRGDFWAMVVVVADTDMTRVVVGGMAEEVGAQVLFFLRSASGLSLKFSGKSRPLIHYPIFIHRRLSCLSNWQPYTHACYEHIHVRHLLSFAFLDNGARNACWHFIASLLRTSLGPIPSNGARNAVLASPSKDTKERQPIGLYN
jgi:hypothetical protein